jgi:hypothetical protein
VEAEIRTCRCEDGEQLDAETSIIGPTKKLEEKRCDLGFSCREFLYKKIECSVAMLFMNIEGHGIPRYRTQGDVKCLFKNFRWEGLMGLIEPAENR